MTSRAWFLLTLFAVAVVVAVGVWALGDGGTATTTGDGTENGSPPPEDPNGGGLHGSGGGSDPEPIEPPPIGDDSIDPDALGLQTVRGRVVGRDGSPVGGALVYLLPRHLPGAEALEPWAHARADGEGRFALRHAQPQGCWLGAYREGFLPGFATPGETDARVVLEPGPVLEVVCEGEGTAFAGRAGFTVSSTESSDAYLYPGPGSRPQFRVGRTVAFGERVSLQLATPGPVQLTADVDTLACDPPTRLIGSLPATARLTFRPSRVLSAQVVDADTGVPVVEGGTLLVHDPGTGAEVARRSGRAPDGRYTVQTNLPAGTYDVAFVARGYEAFFAPGVEISDAGSPVVLDVTVRRDARLGGWTFAGLAPRSVAIRPAGRSQGGWRGLPLQADGGSSVRAVGLDPGTYDVLAWRLHEGRVLTALRRGVEVRRDALDELRFDYEPGRRFPTVEVAGTQYRAIANGLGALPVLDATRPPRAPGPWPMTGRPGVPVRIGPYPVDGLRFESAE